MSSHPDAIPTPPPEAEVDIDPRFIPVRPEALARAIASEPEHFGRLAECAVDLLEAIATVIELETAELRRALDRRYAPFNPHRDTVALDDEREATVEPLCAAMRYVFQKANFTHLDDVDIGEAVRVASSSGLRVRLDPTRVRHLELFVRGIGTEARRKRSLRAPLRGRTVTLDVYKRLGVIVRPSDRDDVVLKLYRDIPVADVEALLPHAQVEMSWVDRAKVAVGGAGALGGVGTKIVQGGMLLSIPSLAIPLAVALGGMSVKSFFGYRRAKRDRLSQRTRNLYNQSVASNGAVLHVLLSFVAAQEIDEALLLYAYLAARPEVEDLAGADRRIEAWLADRFGVRVDFEIADAVETLERLRLLVQPSPPRVVPPDEAFERLRAHAVERLSAGYHIRAAGMQLAD